MAPVIPNLYFLIGWKYSRRPSNPYTAPSGTMTVVPDGALVPCCADREVFLFLSALAHDIPWAGQPVTVDARDMRRWLDSGRRLDNSIKHLRWVMSCKFIVPVSGEMHARITIGAMRQTAEHRFLIFFSPEFLAECSRGIPYSLETAARLRGHPAIFDLYLVLLGFVHDVDGYDEFTHEFTTYARIPLPERIGNARRALKRRLAALRGILPDVHASMAPGGTNILIDIGRPRRTAHAGGSPETWKLRQEFGRMIRAMAPDERRLFGRVMQRMAEYEREVDAPMPWSNVLDMLRQAESETARAMDRVDGFKESLREPTDPNLG